MLQAAGTVSEGSFMRARHPPASHALQVSFFSKEEEEAGQDTQEEGKKDNKGKPLYLKDVLAKQVGTPGV
jgi:hypothetical protein